MNIGRYNVGGGDYVQPPNEKAQIYDLRNAGEKESNNPQYGGAEMSADECLGLQNAKYTVSDADFGIIKGSTVGRFKQMGWVNKLGDAVGDGGNVNYTIDVADTASYTVKLLLQYDTNNASDKRDAAIRVNPGAGGTGGTDYTVDKETVYSHTIANSGNYRLFLVPIENVQLNAGTNKIVIGGSTGWLANFVKIAVIKAGDEGTIDEGTISAEDEVPHPGHIVRSDSGVPGYAKDVTKVDPSKNAQYYIDQGYARVDMDCGYAWKYDWNADKNQMNVLKAAAAASGTDFIAEAFSNSPPYFMTKSGCSTGNTDSSKDNLRDDSVNAFAAYMADVIEHWNNEGVIHFQSATPMNEPYTNYWGANSDKQEGCHFDQGNSQSRIIVALDKELKKKGIDIILSGTDETSIDTQISSYNNLSDEAKGIVERIDTHTYSGSNRAGLQACAKEAGKNLWMSEVSGSCSDLDVGL